MKSTGKLHEAPKVQVAAPCDTLVAQKCRSNAEVFGQSVESCPIPLSSGKRSERRRFDYI